MAGLVLFLESGRGQTVSANLTGIPGAFLFSSMLFLQGSCLQPRILTLRVLDVAKGPDLGRSMYRICVSTEPARVGPGSERGGVGGVGHDVRAPPKPPSSPRPGPSSRAGSYVAHALRFAVDRSGEEAVVGVSRRSGQVTVPAFVREGQASK